MRAASRFVRLTLLVASLSACASEPTRPVPVASVLISPGNALAVVTQIVQLKATALDASGNPLPAHETKWSSKDTTKATVSSDGEVRTKALGSVEVTATIQEKAAAVTITIVPVPLAIRVTTTFFTAFSWWGNVYTTPICDPRVR